MRIKFFRVIAVWLATLTAFGGMAVLGASAAHADTVDEENQFLALTNQLRSSLGIQTLAPQDQLTSIARQWSAKMAADGTISHNQALPNQVTANWTQLGENVGMGGAVQAIQTAFINSPHHYENLANGAYNFVGIGVVHGTGGTIFVTVDFMAAPASAGGGSAAPKATAPRSTSPPRTAAPAAPRATTPRPATPAPAAKAATTPAPAPVAPAAASKPVGVKGSPAFPQILETLRSVDVTQ